ncbi:MAG: hypothetical protein JKP90_19250 [Desulfofustis sp. PB-SRB1]|jgi:hypothetical protein|nr:hypothetical protein [Desulfofustis sp. PB-SRB1]
MRGDRDKQHKREQGQNTAATEVVDEVPVIGGKWVYMVALAVQSIGEIKLLEAAAKKS